ncbi:MAG: 50S ribosomal protein L23 [Candidatus Doudnabacteria bacterium]|nr:50S ribosomal protein L23 [Candidatus Doudnabacteria bacterium]
MKLIKKPVITEKTMQLAQTENKYTFEVTLSADKTRASKEIEKMFEVKVAAVNAHTRLGQTYGFGKYRQMKRRKPSQKFMIFKLQDGQKIDLFETK